MAMTTLGKNGRIYQRAFDHDEARELRAEGWTWTALAERYGVSTRAVERVVRPESGERIAAYGVQYMRDHYREPCKGGCGALVWTNRKNRSGLCPECHGKQRASSVRASTLRCANCRNWKPDQDFPRYRRAKARRGRHSTCRECCTTLRRKHRQAKPDMEQRTQRRRYEKRERHRMTEFIVFQPNGDGYKEIARVDAVGAALAIEKAATEPGEYVAVPVSRFRLMKLEPVQALRVVTEKPSSDGASAPERTKP